MSGSAAAVMTKPAFRKIEWLKRDIAIERRDDGTLILKSRIELSCRALSRRSGVGCLSHEFRQAGSIKRARRWLSWDVLARHLSRVVQAKVLHGNVTERF